MPEETITETILSTTVVELLNTYPGLGGKNVLFSSLSHDNGFALFPSTGAAVASSRESITGHVREKRLYPFNLVYRAALKTEAQRVKVKEMLDNIGKWLQRQPVIVSGAEVQLSGYPDLTSGGVITSIERTGQSYLFGAYDNGIEDWVLPCVIKFDVEFDR